MNIGFPGEGFPYVNFHDMNLDWMIKIAKDFLDQYTHIQDIIAQGLDDLQEKTDTGLADLQTKYETLEGLLDAWYNEHSEDIAGQLADALDDLQTAIATGLEEFTVQATSRAAAAIESIPDDYSAFYAAFLALRGAVNLLTGGTPIEFTTGKFVNTSGAVGSTVDLTMVAHASYCCAIVDCTAGDRFVLNAKGAGVAHTWCFVDSDSEMLSKSAAYVIGSNAVVTAPSNASKLVINSTVGELGNCVKNFILGQSGAYLALTSGYIVTFNSTTKVITIPNGFIIYKGVGYQIPEGGYSIDCSAYNVACILYLKRDGTIYPGNWYNTNPATYDDEVIGYVWGNSICINGVEPDRYAIIDSNSQFINGTMYSPSYLAMSAASVVTYDYTSKILTIPTGFTVYKGKGIPRQETSLDLSSVLAQNACALFVRSNGTLYAAGWNGCNADYPSDQMVGYVFTQNVIINGVNPSQIGVLQSGYQVFCFGDSMTAGAGTDRIYHMYWKAFNPSFVFYNWGVGGTGYILTKSGEAIICGNGNVGMGEDIAQDGNNSILEVMQSIDSVMPNITIFGGTNDFGSSQTASDFRTAVQNTLDYALTKTANILVITPIRRHNGESANHADMKLHDYSDIIIEECISRGIAYVDGYDVSINPANSTSKAAFAPDGLHPNRYGQKRIARKTNEKLMEVLGI